jgi:hypothetical protein
MGSAYMILIAKRDGKRSRGIQRYRKEDNIKTVVNELKCEIIDWIHMTG